MGETGSKEQYFKKMATVTEVHQKELSLNTPEKNAQMALRLVVRLTQE